MRAGQTELVAQQVGEMHAWLDRLAHGTAIDGQGHGRHWAIACAAARARAVRCRRTDADVAGPARRYNSAAAASSRRAAPPRWGTPMHIVRASSTTTDRRCVAQMATT